MEVGKARYQSRRYCVIPTVQGGIMTEFDAKILAIANKAVAIAQEENRRLGIPNVYSLNGTIVWQYPDGSVTTSCPDA
jgi:hypothetical protein